MCIIQLQVEKVRIKFTHTHTSLAKSNVTWERERVDDDEIDDDLVTHNHNRVELG